MRIQNGEVKAGGKRLIRPFASLADSLIHVCSYSASFMPLLTRTAGVRAERHVLKLSRPPKQVKTSVNVGMAKLVHVECRNGPSVL